MRHLKIIALCALAVCATGCSDRKEALRATKAYGFKNVEITGHRWTGCGEHDDYSTGFTATNPNGEEISGVVCSQGGFFGKSSTVRID